MSITPGFENLQDYRDRKVTEVGVEVVNEAIVRHTQAAVDSSREALGFFAQRTTKHQWHYDMPVDSKAQPTTQDSVPEPVTGHERLTYKIPMFAGSDAFGDNMVQREYATVSDYEQSAQRVTRNNANWLLRYMLAALYGNAAYTYKDEVQGDLTIKPAADNDSVRYLKADGTVSTNSSVHHLAQANAIADGADDPFESDANLLDEYTLNAGDKIVIIPTNLRSSVTSLSQFIPVADMNIDYGMDTDLASFGEGAPLGKQIGYLEDAGVAVWVWRKLTPSYYLMFSDNGLSPLYWREHVPENLRGIVNKEFTIKGNHQQRSFYWWSGFGVRNCTSFLVRRIGNASYAVPTGYQLPHQVNA